MWNNSCFLSVIAWGGFAILPFHCFFFFFSAKYSQSSQVFWALLTVSPHCIWITLTPALSFSKDLVIRWDELCPRLWSGPLNGSCDSTMWESMCQFFFFNARRFWHLSTFTLELYYRFSKGKHAHIPFFFFYLSPSFMSSEKLKLFLCVLQTPNTFKLSPSPSSSLPHTAKLACG